MTTKHNRMELATSFHSESTAHPRYLIIIKIAQIKSLHRLDISLKFNHFCNVLKTLNIHILSIHHLELRNKFNLIKNYYKLYTTLKYTACRMSMWVWLVGVGQGHVSAIISLLCYCTHPIPTLSLAWCYFVSACSKLHNCTIAHFMCTYCTCAGGKNRKLIHAPKLAVAANLRYLKFVCACVC